MFNKHPTALLLVVMALAPVAAMAQWGSELLFLPSSRAVSERSGDPSDFSILKKESGSGAVQIAPAFNGDGLEVGAAGSSNSHGSVALPVEQGGTGVLELSFAARERSFGAALITLSFDPAALEVVDVTASDGSAGNLLMEHVLLPGEVRVIAVNTSSLDGPVGTVKLAKVTVRPLADAGTVIGVYATQNGAFDTELVAYRDGLSGHANVVVTEPATTSATDDR